MREQRDVDRNGGVRNGEDENGEQWSS